MGAPAQLPPIIDRYGGVVDMFLPGEAADARRRRAGILYLRDKANAGQCVACWEAGRVLAVIESLGSVHAFAAMTDEQLETVHLALTKMMIIARSLEARGPKGVFDACA